MKKGEEEGGKYVKPSHIPVWVEQDETICTDHVETTTTGFTGEEENECIARGVVEFVDKWLALLQRSGSVKPQARPRVLAAQSLQYIKRLRVVGHKHDTIRRLRPQPLQKRLDDGEFARQFWSAVVPAAATLDLRRKEVATVFKALGVRSTWLESVPYELRMIAELLEHRDGCETARRHTGCCCSLSLVQRMFSKVAIDVRLRLCETHTHDLHDFWREMCREQSVCATKDESVDKR